MSLSNNPDDGPPPDYLTALDGIYSLRIHEVCRITGFSRSLVYVWLGTGRLRSFKTGKSRMVYGDSLRQLLSELATNQEAAPPPSRRQPVCTVTLTACRSDASHWTHPPPHGLRMELRR